MSGDRMYLSGSTWFSVLLIRFDELIITYSHSIPSAHITWLTQHVDVVDLDVDVGTEAVVAVDPVVELARMKRRNGA